MQRPCPICGQFPKTLLKTLSYESYEGSVLPTQYRLVSCNKCGFVFDDFDANQETFSLYYKQQNKYDTSGITGGGAVSPLERKRYESYIRFLSGFIDKSARIVDIGCGQGGFLRTLKEAGYTNLFAVDPSPFCVDLIKKHGIDAVCSTLEDYCPSQECDLVCLTAVMEHLFDVHSAVKALIRITRNKGGIFIDVPDASRYQQFYLAPFYRYDQEHINHFSVPHLKNLFAQYGYETISSQEIVTEVSKYNSIPVCMGLFRANQNHSDSVPDSTRIIPDFTLREKIIEDVELSDQDDYEPVFRSIISEGKPVIVWGLGAHTLRLLKESSLKSCKIHAFVDNNPHKVDKRLMGIPIISSHNFFDDINQVPIVICASALYGNEMAELLKEKGFVGRIVILAR